MFWLISGLITHNYNPAYQGFKNMKHVMWHDLLKQSGQTDRLIFGTNTMQS